MTASETQGKSSPSAQARIITEAWVSGSAHMAADAASGRELTANRVPHVNVIGRMTMLEIMFRVAVEPASSPAVSPRRENVAQQRNTDSVRPGVKAIAGSTAMPATCSRHPPCSEG